MVDSLDLQTAAALCSRPHLVDLDAIRRAHRISGMEEVGFLETVEMQMVCPLCLAKHSHHSIRTVDRLDRQDLPDRPEDLFRLDSRALFRRDFNLEVFRLPCRILVVSNREVFHLSCRILVELRRFRQYRRDLLRSDGSTNFMLRSGMLRVTPWSTAFW